MAKRSLRNADFWAFEEKALWDELAPQVLDIILAGGQAGEANLPPNLRSLISWDVFNQKAIDYLDRYRLSWVSDISRNTRNQAMRSIDQWLKSGEPVTTLEARLAPLFSDGRAHRIAVTEVTRIYAEGNKDAWEATGVVESVRWNTGVDEKVCPVCGELDGEIVDLGSAFYSRYLGVGIAGPPAHVNCRCYLSPVVSLEKAGGRFEDILNDGD